MERAPTLHVSSTRLLLYLAIASLAASLTSLQPANSPASMAHTPSIEEKSHDKQLDSATPELLDDSQVTGYGTTNPEDDVKLSSKCVCCHGGYVDEALMYGAQDLDYTLLRFYARSHCYPLHLCSLCRRHLCVPCRSSHPSVRSPQMQTSFATSVLRLPTLHHGSSTLRTYSR